MNYLFMFCKRAIAWLGIALFSCCPAQAASVTYLYDGLHRLVRADYGGVAVFEYVYDATGNITRKMISNSQVIKGDLDGDGNVAVMDAILGLRALTGMTIFVQVDTSSNVNGDGKIGMEDVVYILKNID